MWRKLVTPSFHHDIFHWNTCWKHSTTMVTTSTSNSIPATTIQNCVMTLLHPSFLCIKISSLGPLPIFQYLYATENSYNTTSIYFHNALSVVHNNSCPRHIIPYWTPKLLTKPKEMMIWKMSCRVGEGGVWGIRDYDDGNGPQTSDCALIVVPHHRVQHPQCVSIS